MKERTKVKRMTHSVGAIRTHDADDWGFDVRKTSDYRKGVEQLKAWHRMCAKRRAAR